MSIAKGQPWGRPCAGPADIEGTGDDAMLARLVEHVGPGRLVRFRPTESCHLARAIGMKPDPAAPRGGVTPTPDPTMALPIDVLSVRAGEQYGQRLAVNSVVLGVDPGSLRRRHRAIGVAVSVDGRALPVTSATTVAVMNGQYLGSADLAPRGHPGDGRAEVVVIDVPPDDRREMRSRLSTGTHVPHSGITIVSGHMVRVTFAKAVAFTVDGHAIGSRADVTVEVLASQVSLWV